MRPRQRCSGKLKTNDVDLSRAELYSPNLGFLLSRNAVIPSAKSSPVAQSKKLIRSLSNCLFRLLSNELLISCLVYAWASFEPCANLSNKASHFDSSSLSAAIQLTNPNRSACLESNRSPNKESSMARFVPTILGKA